MVRSWKDLTLREKIGQTVMLQVIPEDHIAISGSIEKFLQDYPIGAIFAAGRLVNGVMFEIEQFGDVMQAYVDHTSVPLLVSADMEHGTKAGDGILFPSLMGLGATDDPDIAYDFGRALAVEARAAGLNWLFSPVVDISIHPFMGTDSRSIGSDPEKIVKMTSRIMDGMMDCGVMPTAKHFPGGGHTNKDSHMVRVQAKCTREEWEQTNGYIYRKLIAHGLPAIMTHHCALPCVQTEKELENKGFYKIATLSKEITTDLLKKELGFGGVVITDALCMGGFAGPEALDNMVESFKAGSDMLLWPPAEYIDYMEQKILAGEVSMERLDDAVSRVWALKEKLGLFPGQERKPMPDLPENFIQDVARRMSEGCLTLVNNDGGRIPFSKDAGKKVLVGRGTPDDNSHNEMATIADAFARRNIACEVWRDTWCDALNGKKQVEYDLIIFAVSRLFHHPIGSVDLYGNNALSVWAMHNCDPSKTIAASFGTPYIYKWFVTDDMYINAYAPTPELMEAFVAALLGEIPFQGKTPVDLSKVTD